MEDLMQEKILIVDDDVDTLRLVGLMLQRKGYQIVAANHGNQALMMAKTESPDLILLDIMMPDLDGYEVTRRLRDDSNTADIPIIMFTAKSQVEDRATGFEAGADDYLTKPIQPNELFEHVREILERKKATGSGTPIQRGQASGILAAQGGIGISTLAINLGISLYTKTLQEVIVAELRPGEGSLALELGLPVGDGLNKLLEMEPSSLDLEDLETVLVRHSSGIRLLLSSYQPRDTQYRSMAIEMSAIARRLPDLASFVLLDLGPGIYPATEKVLEQCEQLVLALEPSHHAIKRTKVMIEDLLAMGFRREQLHIVLINRFQAESQPTWTQVQEQIRHPIAVAFSPVPELAYSTSITRQPIVSQQPGSQVAQQFTRLADNLINIALQTT
jgi:DNA-binding response OmpR family regulator